ncbi:T9SS type A sorting domain-containing protein [candidate division WOR-3 bacterium]|nr:T9SS type A sorting domain-containing protein [candidate division WOR-3 bacterium]
MKSLIKTIIGILLFSSLLLNASVIYNLHFNPSDLDFETKDNFDIISIKGTSFMDDVGEPMLPVKYLHLIIPQGTEADSVEVEIHSNYQIPGNYNIYPAQPPIPTGEDTTFVPPDSSVYNSDNPYPSKKVRILKTGNFAGNSIATIAFCPLQYKPASGQLIFYTNVSITLDVRASGSSGSRPTQRTPNSYRIYKKTLYSIVDNDWNIPGYCWEPSIVENIYTLKSKQIVPLFPYIIITADSLKDAFSPLIEWLTRKGIEAHTISVSTIVSEYPGGDPVSGIVDDAGSIRAFLKDGYEGGFLQWSLLGGDEDIVPCRYGSKGDNNASTSCQVPADLYFADFDGDWEVDGDGLYGEKTNDNVDYGSEVWVGRLPCHNSVEINNWIEKLLSYEKNPGNGDYNYLIRVFWSAGQYGRGAPADLIPYFPAFFAHDTTLLEERDPLFPSGSLVIDTMSHGFGNYNFYEHGAPDQFTVSSANNGGGTPRHFAVSLDSCDEFFNNHSGSGCIVETGNGLDSLINEEYYGWLYTISCDIAAYDQEDWALYDNYCGPCLARAFTTLEKRGGPTFLGNTRSGYFGLSRTLHKHFLTALFSDSIFWVGVSEANSKASYFGLYKHFLCLSHDLFGCPEMPIWTDIPQHLLVSFPPFVKTQDSLLAEFTVEVTDTLGNPIDSAYICLWKGEEVYKTGFTSAGITTFQISPQTEGWLSVTVTKPNYIPFEDSSYILEELITCVNTSEATYPNAQKKIRYPDKSDDDIGLIYSSDEYSISATGSPDNGNSWNNPSFVGQGGGPSLTIRLFKEYDFYHWNNVYLDSSGVVSAAGTTSVGNEIVVPQEWQHQYLWQPSNPSIQLISSASDRGDNLHSCILYGEWGGNDEAIRYREFEWEEFPDNSWRLVTDEVVTSSSNITHHSHPAIAVDLRGIPHLVWEWNGEVLYSTKYQGRWCEPVRLSRSEHFSKEPFIEARGDYVRAVWVQEDEKTESGDICSRTKLIDDPPDKWEEIEYIRKTENDSRYPQIAGGENYSWCEYDDENWEVFIFTGDTTLNLSNSFFDDKYPQIDYNPHGYLYYGWTKTGRQGSAVVEKTLSIGKTSYYTVNGGDSISSKRLIHRDGFTPLSGYYFDYAQDSLVYHCPFLDSSRLFNIKIIGYSGGLSSWNDSLSGLTILIDGQEIQGRIHTSFLPVIECEIPREMYRDDEEVVITLKPEENEYALLSRLWLFDSEIPFLHRKDSDRKVVNKGVPYYLTIHPNLSINNRINIEFGLPTKKRVDISIYDCTGRQVVKLLSEKMSPGIHRISWKGYDKNRRELPSGVYFCNLETADIRMVKKIILIR